MKRTKIPTRFVPPDGGWGWVIVLAYGICNGMVIPVMQNFGLIFKETFVDIGLNMKDSSVIINTNSAFGMLMGLVNGSILKQFGYRKGAFTGGLLVSIGVILTAYADNFYWYLFSYGFITSFGIGLTMAAIQLALNSYFREKRSRATGYGMTITGVGSTLMPLLLSYLIDEYGPSGAMLLIGAISLHSVAASCLLQPLKWHMKEIMPDVELYPLKKEKDDELKENLIQNEKNEKKIIEDDANDIIDSTLSIDHDIETNSIYGFDTPLPRRKTSTSSAYDAGRFRKRQYTRSISQPAKSIPAVSVNSLNSLRSIAEDDKITEIDNKNIISISTDDEKNILAEQKKEPTTFFVRLFRFCDLDLLKDPGYLNLMLGMSLAICAEISFSLLTPFILNDYGLNTFESAQVMSTIAAADIICRFCSPFVADWFDVTPKIMYMISLVMLISSRTALIFAQSSFYSVLAVAVALGAAKGFRTVFMSLLIPNYVPIEKLASASGLQMVVNGVINIISGPILGAIRDSTGSYDQCIIILNSITFATLLMWTIEIIFVKLKRKQ